MKKAAARLNLATFLERSRVNGPGTRAVVWVQGCPIRCPGCFNPSMWSFEPKELVEVTDLAEHIAGIDGIDGVTFSGGEPFAQAGALAALGGLLRKRGLSIVTFTGYTAERVTGSDRDDWWSLLDVTDLLIAGPFKGALGAAHPLCGSRNQRLVFLTERLRDHPDLAGPLGRVVEYTIMKDGTTVTTGFPEPTQDLSTTPDERGDPHLTPR
ncbi:MAG: 4Fe-4S single cluster domain-containing protein [Chloroflexota bacterium]